MKLYFYKNVIICTQVLLVVSSFGEPETFIVLMLLMIDKNYEVLVAIYVVNLGDMTKMRILQNNLKM